ncbi:MAG: TetR/AcrR family transcriptional regulator [Solirubrobacterales bacterium]
MAPTDAAPDSTRPLFPQLSSGRHGMPAAEVERHQKARLEGAMVEATARHGFAGTTVAELVGLAGVSKTTFYQHFDSKQDCFLATFDAIIDEVTARVSETYREPGDFRERLTRALSMFMEIAADEPAAASLAAIDSLTLGKAGVAHRERGSQAFGLMVRQSFDHSPSPIQVSDMTVRAIVAGIRGVVYRCLRAEEAKRLPSLVNELVEWALAYQQEPGEMVLKALKAAERAQGDEEMGAAVDSSWEEPPDSETSRRNLSQRERIVRGAARLVVERGYDSLSIPAISGAAGVSNQTFYEHFQSKRDPLLAAFRKMAEEGLRFAGSAFAAEGGRPEAVGAGVRAMMRYVAAHELFARLAFLELPTAGPVALDEADDVLDRFSGFLHPPLLPPQFEDPPATTTLHAIATGIWATIQYEIVHGRRDALPALAPQIAWIALAPVNA